MVRAGPLGWLDLERLYCSVQVLSTVRATDCLCEQNGKK